VPGSIIRRKSPSPSPSRKAFPPPSVIRKRSRRSAAPKKSPWNSRPDLLDDRFYFSYGAAVERNKQFDEAANLFRKSIHLAPVDADPQRQARALNYLGYMWLEQNRNLKEAGELIIRANDLLPDEGAFVDSLGWYYFLVKDYPKALIYSLPCRQIDGSNRSRKRRDPRSHLANLLPARAPRRSSSLHRKGGWNGAGQQGFFEAARRIPDSPGSREGAAGFSPSDGATRGNQKAGTPSAVGGLALAIGLAMPELAEVEFYRRTWAVAVGELVLSIDQHPQARVFRGFDP